MGKYSLEIASRARKDRIIYRVFENRVVVLIVSAIGHYGDK